MGRYVVGLNPGVPPVGKHDPSAVLFEDGALQFGVEEERLSRRKHAVGQFPEGALRACLAAEDLELSDIDEVAVSATPRQLSQLVAEVGNVLSARSVAGVFERFERPIAEFLRGPAVVDGELDRRFGVSPPSVTHWRHHECHAASALVPAPFSRGLVLTIDGRGETASTVVWRGEGADLERLRSYRYPNSLGLFFGTVTEFLGYDALSDEGKVMGLAPYGGPNPAIEESLRGAIRTGVDYDVTEITAGWTFDERVERLAATLGRPAKTTPEAFTQWEKELAWTAQQLLQETVTAIVSAGCRQLETANVAMAGGVALNCKLNHAVERLPPVETLFVQPIANDAGAAVGAGWLATETTDVDSFSVAVGPAYGPDTVERALADNGLSRGEPLAVDAVAERLADGELVGWARGPMEMGPRALGHRSILADPRTSASRARINRAVKHREAWRPFAPALTAGAASEYLVSPTPAQFMIKSFTVREEKRAEIPAVLHPADGTARPQLVERARTPTFHALLKAFEAETGVPVLLNTSFNDHGEPIVNTPTEAIKDFYGTGLDALVLGDRVLTK